jgi:hypothetical protein
MAADTSFEVQRRDKAKKYLRLFLLDNEEFNRLLRRKETDDDRLGLALDLVLSDWNSTTPVITHVTYSNFPSLYLLILGGVAQCLRMQSLYQTRNALNYQAGGSSFSRSDKGPSYFSMAQNLLAEFEMKKLNMKIQSNVASGYGGFASEYLLIGYDW